MGFFANSDILETDRDRIAARINRIDRLLVRRYVDERHNLTREERGRLEREREKLRAVLRGE